MDNFKAICKIVEIGETLKTRSIKKVVVTLSLTNAQTMYVDVLDKRISQLKNLSVDDIVEVEYSFRGSETKFRKYNNLFCHSIKKL